MRPLTRAWVLAAMLGCAAAMASGAVSAGALHLFVRPQNEPARLLEPADFVVKLNGKDAPVLNAQKPRDSQMILLVLDLAGDIADAQAAKAALIAEIAKLPPATFVALIRAQDGPAVLVDPSADRDAIAQAIEAYPVTGKAGLLDSLTGIETLADSIAKASNVRTATLYITDSEVRNYREDFANPVINSSDPHDLSRRFPEALIQDKIDKLEKAMAARETPVFVVHLRYRTAPLNAAYQAGLKRLAETTSGGFTVCASPAEIPEAIAQALAAVSSQYMLTIGLPAKASSAIQVHVETRDSLEPPANLVYRQRLSLRQR